MQPYTPDVLPLQKLDYGRLIGLIGPANAALARYDGLLTAEIMNWTGHVLTGPRFKLAEQGAI